MEQSVLGLLQVPWASLAQKENGKQDQNPELVPDPNPHKQPRAVLGGSYLYHIMS